MVNLALPLTRLRSDRRTMFGRTPIIAAGLLLLTSAALAETVPKPRPKPSARAAVQTVGIPIPRPNPHRAKPQTQAKGTSNNAPGAWPAATPAEALASCRDALAGLDIGFKPLPPIGTDNGCGIAAPIEVSSIAGVTLKPPAIINCAAAKAMSAWVSGNVQPAAKRRLKTTVSEIHVAASYVCRRRNNAASGKLSEHAKGNAIDMSGFSFAKSDAVAVGGGWGEGLLASIGLSKSGPFLNDIRAGACTHFTTVLGPGSDRYHGDHFHVDVIVRRGGYRICK